MALADQLEKFSKTSPKVKLAIGVGFSAMLWGVFYFLLYAEVSDRADSLRGQISRLEDEKTSLEDKKQKYMAFRAEVTQLLEEQKELVRVLPTEEEIPSFLQAIHAQAELTGLSILTFRQMKTQTKGFYARIPVSMVITGTYHQINRFFFSVGNMKRIVNISNVKLGGAKGSPLGVMLKANFVASTFRFLPPGGKGKKGKG